MNQYQNRNTEEQKTFLSKIKDNYSARFGNLSITSSIQKASSYVDKDGPTEKDTLIHNAFVKYFDSKGEPYPEWLGVPQRQQGTSGYQRARPEYGANGLYSSLQYQPVYAEYNKPQPQSQRPQTSSGEYSTRPEATPSQSSTYKPRSQSRLQDMYNKSRQQHTPGAGYNTINQAPNRSNSSTSGSRLRERMMNSTSMTGMNNYINDTTNGNSKATWGKR